MAAFKLEPRVAVLEFDEGHFLSGLEAKVSLDVGIDMYQHLTLVFSDDGDDVEQTEKVKRFRDQIEMFGDHVLLEWNFEDANGEPVEASGAGLASLPFHVALGLLTQWVSLVMAVPAPLVDGSASGAPSAPELSEVTGP